MTLAEGATLKPLLNKGIPTSGTSFSRTTPKKEKEKDQGSFRLPPGGEYYGPSATGKRKERGHRGWPNQ